MSIAPTEVKSAETFEDLYAASRGDLYRALATITDDPDLATEAIDIGFTRWRRKVRKPTSVEAQVGVMAEAYRWAKKQAGKSSPRLSGFRLPGESPESDHAAIDRFNKLSMDERAVLAMRHLLGWTDADVSHAIEAQGVAMAGRALGERLAKDGYDDERIGRALQAHATSLSAPLSRVEAVKAKGTMQKVAAFAGAGLITVAVVAGGAVFLGNRASADPADPGTAAAGTNPALTGGLTPENAVWQRVPAPVNGDNIQTLTHDGTDFYLMANDNQGRPVMMRSDNGIDWIQVPGPAGGQNMWFQQLVATPEVLLAVGNGFDENRGSDSTAVFISTDRETWTRTSLPVEDEVEIGGQIVGVYTWVSTVSIDASGYTIIGNQGAEFDPERLLREVVDPELLRNGWGTSADGMVFYDNQGREVESKTWDELGLDPELGALLSGNRPIQWKSTDGIEWEVADVSLPPTTQGIGAYVDTGQVEAALAWGNFGASVWVKNGDDWVRPDVEGSLTAMTSWNGQLLVSGVTKGGEAAIWATTDGVTWDQRKVPLAGIQQFFTSASGLVGLSYGDAANALGPAEIQVDDLTVLASSDGRFEVKDAEGNTIIEVLDQDSGRGEVISITDPDTDEIVVSFDRAALENAWEAVYREADINRPGGGGPQVSILISSDGLNWSVIETEDDNFYPNAVAYGNDALLMVGWSEGGGIFPGGGGGQRLMLATPGG